MARRKSKPTPEKNRDGRAKSPSSSGKDAFDNLFADCLPELRKRFGEVDFDETVSQAYVEGAEAWPRGDHKAGDYFDWLFQLMVRIRERKRMEERRRGATPPSFLVEQIEAGEGDVNEGVDTWKPTDLPSDEQALHDFIQKLPELHRDTLIEFFNGKGYTRRVAKKHGLSPGYISNLKKELWSELEKHFASLGYDLSKVLSESGSFRATLRRFLVHTHGRNLSDEELDKIIEGEPLRPTPMKDGDADVRALSLPDYISTGFPALDDLLGGKGFIQGSTILIRGQPGTGKTTLGLQIAKRAMDAGHFFVFAAVEDIPGILLNQVTQSFWVQNYLEFLGDPSNWKEIDLASYFDRDVGQRAKAATAKGLMHDVLSEAERKVLDQLPKVLEGVLGDSDADRFRSAVRSALRKMDVDLVLRELWDQLSVPSDRPVILVVDSLNALINAAAMRFHHAPDRQLMLNVLNSFRHWRRGRRGQVTVIFLVEQDSRIVNAAASYLADVVIALDRREVEHVIYETEKAPSKWLQGMRFCRVEKGRGLPIQDRACVYEFVKADDPAENGIVFLPTYGARGVVSLFHENQPMLDVIRTLRTHDVPELFPQVLVQQFSRTALQRAFSASRRRTRIALRHPMMLYNIDEYWLKRLREQDLIQPIPAKRVHVFPLSLEDSPGSRESSPFISELAAAKESMYAKAEKGDLWYYGVPQMANVSMLVYRKDLLRKISADPPETWEEVEQICQKLREADGLPHKLYLELTTYDTFLATALELSWSHGAFWRTRRTSDDQLKIEFEAGSGVVNLIAALARLKYWIFRLQILPKDCSVDPKVDPKQDWVFARHWYSTWVNSSVLAKRKGNDSQAEYGVLPIPIDASHKKRAPHKARHHSSWGEWYLAILRGSENIDLGIELINNLMTARKITERARSGAALPTAEKFYSITNEDCPYTDLSYKKLREDFFANAKSRSEFDDYPRFARIFSAILRTVATNSEADVVETVKMGLRNIDPDFAWPKNVEQRLAKILAPDLLRCLRPQ